MFDSLSFTLTSVIVLVCLCVRAEEGCGRGGICWWLGRAYAFKFFFVSCMFTKTGMPIGADFDKISFNNTRLMPFLKS